MEFSEELKTGLDGVKTEIKDYVKAEITNALTGVVKSDELQSTLEALKVDDMTIKDIIAAVTKQGNKINEMIAKKEGKQTLKSLLTKVFP